MRVAGKSIAFEASVPLAQVTEYLEQLVEALKAGPVHVRHGDDEVVLGPRDVLDLTVHAKARRKRHRLSLELTWRRKSRDPEDGLALGFVAAPAVPPVVDPDGALETTESAVIDTTATESERPDALAEPQDA